jgi:hypothetical protein
MRTAASLRSSFFANRVRAALWIAASLGAIALVVAVLIGFHSSHPKRVGETRRTAVARYIVRVGRIQIAMAAKVRAVDKSYRLFAKQPQTMAQRVPQYRRSERTLADLRDRLKLVPPPRDARKLRRLLLELADQNIAVAHSVTTLAAYLPALARAQAPLGTAVPTLQAQVRAAKTAHAQAIAFDTYAATTSAVAARVAGIRAPSFFVRARNAETAQLRRLSRLASGIADALRQKQLQQARNLSAQLGQAQAQTAVVQAQHDAAVAYNARLEAISRTAKAIELERRRLERRVPDS